MAALSVNGQTYTVDAPATTPLLWVLRDHLGLTGTKYGCGIAFCGACKVLIGGQAERSCQITLADAVGTDITTIEGLAATTAHKLQEAWIAEQVPQCGYCQSGQLIAAAGLLRRFPNPTDAQIDAAMRNICVCGTYTRIRKAVHRAASM